MIVTITGIFYALAIPFEPQIYAFWDYVILVLQLLNSWDVSVTGRFFRILDGICNHWIPFCQICILN